MKWPKYKVLPLALLLYFVAMAVYSIVHSGGQLPQNFYLICAIEVVILVVLFLLLRRRDKNRL